MINITNQDELVEHLKEALEKHGEVNEPKLFLKLLTAFFGFTSHVTESNRRYKYNTTEVLKHLETITDKEKFTKDLTNLYAVFIEFFNVKHKTEAEKSLTMPFLIAEVYINLYNIHASLSAFENVKKVRQLNSKEKAQVNVLVDALRKAFADRNNILTTLTKFLKVCNKDLVEKKVIDESDLEIIDSASDFLKSIYRWKLVDEDIITQEE